MDIKYEKIKNRFKEIESQRFFLENSSSNIFYAQCYHEIKKDDICCGECGQKVIRVFTQEEIRKRPTIIAEWNKNKKPWEILEEMKSEKERTIEAGLEYLSKNNLSSEESIKNFKKFISDTYCWDKSYLISAKKIYEVHHSINEERKTY